MNRDQFTLAMFALFVASAVCAKYTDRGHTETETDTQTSTNGVDE